MSHCLIWETWGGDDYGRKEELMNKMYVDIKRTLGTRGNGKKDMWGRKGEITPKVFAIETLKCIAKKKREGFCREGKCVSMIPYKKKRGRRG